MTISSFLRTRPSGWRIAVPNKVTSGRIGRSGLLSVIILGLFSLIIGAQTVYDPSLFAIADFNRLRQTQPLEHLRIFRGIVNTRTAELVKNVHFRDWPDLEKNLEHFHRLLAYVLEDIDLCAANPKNRGRSEMIQLELALRASQDRMHGAVRSLPPSLREKPEPVIQRLSIGITVLQKFRKPETKQ